MQQLCDSDITGRSGSERHGGRDEPTTDSPEHFLDFMVPEGIDHRVDHGIIGSREHSHIGVESRVGVIPQEAVNSKGQPTRSKGP